MILSRKLTSNHGHYFNYDHDSIYICTIIINDLSKYISYQITDPSATPLFLIANEHGRILTDGHLYQEVIIFSNNLVSIIPYGADFDKDSVTMMIQRYLSKIKL